VSGVLRLKGAERLKAVKGACVDSDFEALEASMGARL